MNQLLHQKEPLLSNAFCLYPENPCWLQLCHPGLKTSAVVPHVHDGCDLRCCGDLRQPASLAVIGQCICYVDPFDFLLFVGQVDGISLQIWTFAWLLVKACQTGVKLWQEGPTSIQRTLWVTAACSYKRGCSRSSREATLSANIQS